MKKTFISALFSVFALLLFTGSTLSQKMINYTWDTYHVKFQIPSTFTVDKNNDDEFGAGDGDIYLNIYPRKGSSMSYGKMKQALEDWALDSKVYGYDNVNEMENLNGYWGVYIDGKNRSNDLPATLLLLIHPDYTSTQLYIWINYKSSDFDTALKMLKSFKPTY
ncbi:MAG TPA: hypothetical protein VJ455_07635 [Ignavibacteria bacterium]|nr:hypothetical protein [Ignavibacteria bacterium]